MQNVASAKSHLSELIQHALQGKDVVIARGGVPAVRLVPVRPQSTEDPCRVIPELQIAISPEEALAPLNDEDWGMLGQ